MRESEQELADFFEQSPLGLLWVGSDGRILRVNRAQLELLGLSGKEVLGRDIGDYFLDEEIVTQLVAKGETVRDHHARLRQKNGSIKHVLVDANGSGANGQLVHSRWFVRDISRRVELEREILNISEREQTRLSHDLHDDLCQQLTGIQFLSDTLAAELPANCADGTAQAKEIAQLLRNALNQTREMARGLSPVSMEADGLIDALGQLATRMERVFHRECRFRCVKRVRVANHMVGTHLYRIAQEAVSNAIKHGKARRIEIALSARGNDLILGVKDDGIGFPLKPRKQKGMGLRIMQYRAGMISGSLLVQRKTNGGTEVVCTVADGLLSGNGKKTK